jgi:hypothetical protein
MAAHRLEAVSVGHTLVGLECSQEGEAGSRPVNHEDRNRAIERDNRPRRHSFKHLVQR